MLLKRSIRKIYITTLVFFIVFALYSVPNNYQERTIKTSLEVDYVSNLVNHYIYLIDKDEYLVRVGVLVDKEKTEDKAADIVSKLINNKVSYIGLNSVIPKNTVLNDFKIENNILQLDFNSELLNVKKELEEKVIESLVYSLISLEDVKKLSISIDGEKLEELPKSKKKIDLLDKTFGINKEYNIKKLEDIKRVVIYYVKEEANNAYYVPVTKYSNDKRDKIKIIIDNLATSYIYETNLISYLNKDTKLLNYNIDNKTATLNFNDAIFFDTNEIQEEVIYSISASIFDSLDIEKVIFEVNGDIFKIKELKALE